MISAYRRIIKTSVFISAVCMLFLGAISEPLLYCLIGPKWHEAAEYLPLICLSGSLYPLHAINLNMLQVQGRSDFFLYLGIVRKFVGLIPLCVCIYWGVMPMLYVNLITAIIYYFLNSHYPGKLIGYNSWMQLRDVAPSYTLAIIVALSVFFLKFLPISYWIILPLQLIIGACVFLLICTKTKMQEYQEIESMLKPYLSKITK